MSKRPRPNHSPAFTAKIALAAVKGEKTLAQQFNIHPNQITIWCSQLLKGAAGVFGSEVRNEAAQSAMNVKTLHAKISALTLEDVF